MARASDDMADVEPSTAAEAGAQPGRVHGVGLVVGKFSPLHLGHEHLIATARRACARLLVLSWSNPEFAGCEAVRRRAWLERRFGGDGGVSCHVLEPEGVPRNDAPEEAQRAFVARWLEAHGHRGGVDAVFTSEPYGEGFAAHLSHAFARTGAAAVRHHCVDPGRVTYPVSATAIREGRSRLLGADVAADYESALAGHVRAGCSGTP